VDCLAEATRATAPAGCQRLRRTGAWAAPAGAAWRRAPREGQTGRTRGDRFVRAAC